MPGSDLFSLVQMQGNALRCVQVCELQVLLSPCLQKTEQLPGKAGEVAAG